MVSELIKKLLEAGVHFGHQTKRWNPKMKEYIFGERNGVYIIDLEKTAKAIEGACEFLKEIGKKGGNVLFVGTKKQAQEVIAAESEKCGMFHVNYRWLGGTLTNFATIYTRVKRLKELRKLKEEGHFEELNKKEAAVLTKQLEKLEKNLSGIANMDRLPECLFVLDSKREETAVREANKLKIPVVALVDTDCDPDRIDHVIPGNDDALRSISLVCSFVSDAVAEGAKQYKKGDEVKPQPEVAKPKDIKAKIPKPDEKLDEKMEEEAMSLEDKLKAEKLLADEKIKKGPTKTKK